MSFSRGEYTPYNDNNGGYYRQNGGSSTLDVDCNEKTKLQNNLTTGSANNHHPKPVKLQPSWEENNLPEDELNFNNLSMAEASLEVNPPRDRKNFIFIVFLIHGIGTLTPWNMFINAEQYFTKYKFAESEIGYNFPYLGNFLQIITFAAMVPNVVFNWLNVFVQIGGDMTKRIVYSISTVVICFLITVLLAMIDTNSWPEPFFWLTVVIVVIINMANGVYQNTVFGMAAKLPTKYTGAIILGNNISGTFVSLICLATTKLTDDKRMAAIYYFITALFVLFICFDTYFALPLNRFYRHHEIKSKKMLEKVKRDNHLRSESQVPYLRILRQASGQLYNVFLSLFVTLCCFPSIQANVHPSDVDFFLQGNEFQTVTCFLTFNIFAMIGSALAGVVQFPGPRFLWILSTLRIFFIPLFLFSNYHVPGQIRLLPVYIDNDWGYWFICVLMAVTSGYVSSLGMMYVPRSVDERHASTAGMLAGAFLITGLFCGICCSFIWPWAVTHIGY